MAKTKKKVGGTLTSAQQLLLSKDSSFLMQEDYKTLRTNIAFSFPEKGCKCIAVSSASQGEGKSTNAINLTISFAELGRRVLIVDCDLRLPTVEMKLKMKSDKGLSDLLVGDCMLDDAVNYNEEHGIYVLGPGTLPADPTRLIYSKSMGNVIAALRQHFDYIIFDCPPINVVVDAALLAEHVDGYLLVVQHGVTEHKAISRMLQQLEQVNANILGFVYANAPTTDHKYYYKHNYGHGYSYAYGYGYGRRRKSSGDKTDSDREEKKPEKKAEKETETASE